MNNKHNTKDDMVMHMLIQFLFNKGKLGDWCDMFYHGYRYNNSTSPALERAMRADGYMFGSIDVAIMSRLNLIFRVGAQHNLINHTINFDSIPESIEKATPDDENIRLTWRTLNNEWTDVCNHLVRTDTYLELPDAIRH